MLPWYAGLPGAELAVLAMAFAWGATLGSFINVVVYRLPRRESVVVGASRCPACGTPIEPRDNVPVIGWILLGGRCRACGAAISPRYPLVEAACGCIAVAIAAAELVGGGGSLPWLGTDTWHGIDRLLMHGDFRLLVSWALHTGTLVLLVAWSLLAALPEPHRLAHRTAWIAVAIVVGVVACLPDVGPPGIGGQGDHWPHSQRPATVVASLSGAVAGWVLGSLTGRGNDTASYAVFGAVVGWQTLTVVAIATATLRRAAEFARRRGWLACDPLPAVATAAVVFWRPLREAVGVAWEAVGGR